MYINCDHQDMLFALASKHIPNFLETKRERCFCMGLYNDSERLRGVVLFNGHNRVANYAFIHIYCGNHLWASKRIIFEILCFAFEEWKLHKLYAENDFDNVRLHNLLQKIGFVKEAILEDHYGPSKSALILKMFRSDFERIYPWVAEKTAVAQT